MVELSRSFLRERLSRQPGTATLVGVPGQVRVPDDSGLIAQAGATFAQGLQALSRTASVFAERERQLKDAQNVAQTNQALGDFQLGMAPILQGLEDEQVPLLDRAGTLQERGQEAIAGLIENVPKRLQSTFKAEATQQLARFVLREQSTSSARFVEQQQANLPALLSLRAREIVSADERELPALQHGLSVLANSYVATGVLTQPLADVLVAESLDNAMTERTQRAMIAQPQRMLGHLEDIAAGGPGVDGLPRPAEKDLLTLVNQARQQVNADIAMYESQQRQSESRLRQQQDQEQIRIQDRLLSNDLTMDEVHQVQADVRTLGKQRLLKPEDHGRLLREANVIEKVLREGPQVTDTAIKRRMLILLHGELGGGNLDAVRDDIIQGLDDGNISLGDAQTWLGEVTRQRQQNYYTHIPAYQEGRRFLDQTVNYLSDISAVSITNQEEIQILQNRAAYALQAYSQEIRAIWEDGGIRAVENQAAQVSRQILNVFGTTPREVLNYFPEPEVLRQQSPALSVDERYTQAYQRLQADQRLTTKDKAEQFRLLRRRKVLEMQVEVSEAGERQRNPVRQPPSFGPGEPQGQNAAPGQRR